MLLRLAVAQMLFTAIYQFSTLFINTYLFKQNQDIRMVAEYNFYLFFFWGLCFYLGFKCCEKNARFSMVIAGVSSLMAMGLLIAEVSYPLVLGLLMGATGGFFWPPYLSIYRTLGKSSEGSGTFAKASVLASVIPVLIPIFFGHVVEGTGYLVGFAIIALVSAGIIGISLFMPKHHTQKIQLRPSSFRHPSFFLSNVLQGFYFSFIGVAAGLLVYISGEGEANVGTFATFYGLVTLGVNLIMGFLLSQRNNAMGLVLAVMVYPLASTLFLSEWDMRLIVFNFLVAAAGPLFLNPVVGLNFTYINQAFPNGDEGIFIRECGLTVGRLLFFICLALVGFSAEDLAFYAFCLAASFLPLSVYMIIRKWERPSEVAGKKEESA